MRVQCPICAELFSNSSDIAACPCGHVFHNACLAQWRERSNTCPQCRATLRNRHMIQKLYFNDAEGFENREDDYARLKNKNNELEANLHEARCKVSELNGSAQQKIALLNEIQTKLKVNEGVVTELKKSMTTYKSQLTFVQKENVRLSAAENELIVTKKEIENYTRLQQMMDGSLMETGEILNRYSQDPASFRQLATACSLLRKELKTIKSKKAKQTEEMNQLKKNFEVEKRDALMVKAKCKQLSEENQMLKDSVTSVERELQSSHNKRKMLLTKLHELNMEDTSFDRFINESPAPQPSRTTKVPDASTPKIPPIKKAETQNFPVKTSSVAVNVALSIRSNRGLTVKSSSASVSSSVPKQCQDFNIFKRHRQQLPFMQMKSVAASSRDQGYDGFGGHSKPDIFPSGSTKPNKNPKKIKRSFSASNISKFTK